MYRFRILIIFILVLNAPHLFAAACCGGGASFPSLILSDDQAQVGLSSSYSRVVGDVPSHGIAVFRSSEKKESNLTYAIDASGIFYDRWQVGAQLAVIRHSYETSKNNFSAWDFGDAAATLGYEILPEYAYSIWKPRGFLFMQAIFPTGKNVYESKMPGAVDAGGKGYYSLSIGSFLIKSWHEWDTSLRCAYVHSFPKKFNLSDGSQIWVRPGYLMNAALSLGYSPGKSLWRIGMGLNPSYTAYEKSKNYRLVWNSTFDLSRILFSRWVTGLSYNDQTLMGPAKNTTLERGITFFLRYRWER
jgi:hypothetical protein